MEALVTVRVLTYTSSTEASSVSIRTCTTYS